MHTVVPATGWGTPLDQYNAQSAGGQNLAPEGMRLMASDPIEELPEEEQFDPAFCQTWKDDGVQCGARPVKTSADRLCVGHQRAAQREE
jgi:hypothetical protein